MTFDERHDARHLCACGRHLVTGCARTRLALGCAFLRAVVSRYGVIWAQPDREVCE